MRHQCIETSRLLLAVEKYKESRGQNKGRRKQMNKHLPLGADKTDEDANTSR